MKEKKICLIYTGGTIGMVRTRDPDGKLRTHPPKDAAQFAESINNLMPDIVDEIKERKARRSEPLPFTVDRVTLFEKRSEHGGLEEVGMDSSNLCPSDWTQIAEAIYKRRNDYAAFIVSHGTDTMEFSAAAVAFALGPKLNFPVVFTGAQTIPSIKHGDAQVNLLRAIQVALYQKQVAEDKRSGFCEVLIAFNTKVFRACRTKKTSEVLFDAFDSPSFHPVAHIAEEIHPAPWAIFAPWDQKPGPWELEAGFTDNVVTMTLSPGLRTTVLETLVKDETINGIILASFGAGNVPFRGVYDLLPAIRMAKTIGKPVVITSQFPAFGYVQSTYEGSRLATEAGAIPTGNMTTSCAVVKLSWVLHKVAKQIAAGELPESDRMKRVKALMAKVEVGEMDANRKA